MRFLYCPRSLFVLVGSFAALTLAASAQQLCSAGPRDGQACNDAADCPGGKCVTAQGVCSGGSDDGLDCDCPLGTCTQEPACSSDPALGSCDGGLLAGDCCDPAFNCASSSPCIPTQKVCLSGPLKGFPCLQDTHCLGAVCWSTGRVCGDGLACVDNDDCIIGTCEGTGSFPTPTASSPSETPAASPSPSVPPSRTPLPVCTGDCDGNGTVSIEEIVRLVNIALGLSPITSCPAGDTSGDGEITVDEIVTAVSYALTACPGSAPASVG